MGKAYDEKRKWKNDEEYYSNDGLSGSDDGCCRQYSGTDDCGKKNSTGSGKKIVLNTPAEKVWDYISEPANYKKFSGVKGFTCEEKALNAKIELTTKKGSKRKQHISVIDSDRYRICYYVTQSDYAGEGTWVYAFNVLPVRIRNVRWFWKFLKDLISCPPNLRMG